MAFLFVERGEMELVARYNRAPSKPTVLNNFLHGRIPNPPDPSCKNFLNLWMKQ